MKCAPVYSDGKIVGQRIFCSGCQHYHMFMTDPTSSVHWSFNGDAEKPTFTPSLLCNKEYPESRCHSIVTAGKMHFLDDCYHELRGKTRELEDVEVW
jgi:hypothetical protein